MRVGTTTFEVLLTIDSHTGHLMADNSALWLADDLMVALACHPGDFTHMSIQRDQAHGGMDHYDSDCHWKGLCFIGSIVKIDNGEREWIYRVDDYNRKLNAWHAKWPD
jgi:hypothetical protein